MIATIPDPIDSGLDYLFDTTLQALRLGLERSAKEPPAPLRFGLAPDEDVTTPEYAALTATAAGCHARRGRIGPPRSDAMECGRRRRPDAFAIAPPRRAVCASSCGRESPTRGVNVTAMVNALELVGAIARAQGIAPCRFPPRDRSQRSRRAAHPNHRTYLFRRGVLLRLALINGRGMLTSTREASCFHIVTGRNGLRAPHAARCRRGMARGDAVWFDATTAPDDAVECAYLLSCSAGSRRRPVHIRRHVLRALPQVAMLHEWTEFGASTEASTGGAAFGPASRSVSVHIASLRDATRN